MFKVTPIGAVLLFSILAIATPVSRAAGLLVAEGGGSLEIREHHVGVTINNGIAVTHVTQVFVNTEARAVSALYTFPVPANASIAGFSVWIDGREMIGEVVAKQAAREIHGSVKAQGQTSGLLEQSDYRTFNFRISEIAAGAEQKVQVTYYQQVDPDGEWAGYVYPLASNVQQVVNSRVSKAFDITVDVKSAEAILEMSSPSHAKNVTIKRYSNTYCSAALTAAGAGLDRDVVVAYRCAAGPTSARLVAFRENDSDGYFCLTVNPNEQAAPQNAGADYVFLLDVSGSMADDDKLGQSRGTLAAFLELLGPDDSFDLLSFNAAPAAALGHLSPADDANRAIATRFLASRRAYGGTDFNSALAAAYRYARASHVLNMILISDGLNEQSSLPALVRLVAKRPAGSRILCVGVGNDVDRALLQRMADSTGGTAAFITAEDNFHRQAAGLRRKLRQPAVTDATVDIEGVGVRDVVGPGATNLFNGVPVRLYGRYSKPGVARVTLKGTLAGQEFARTFDVSFPQDADADPEIQRMWAWRRVDRLLNSPRLTAGDIDQIVSLGQQYSIASEYTSFIVLENDAAYARWKIAQRNARRLTQDREAQADLASQLQALRRKYPQGMPEPIPRPAGASAANSASLVQSGTPSITPAVQTQFRRSFGGAIDPMTTTLAVMLGVWAFPLAFRKWSRTPIST